MSMAPFKILISGSGIAGSVCAFWLLRAYPDARITIVERAPSLRLTGASVDIRSSAVEIVKWMGVEQAIREHTTNEEGVQCVYRDGSNAWTLGKSGNERVQSVTSEYEIFRGALARIFIEPVEERVELVFDEYVDSFVQSDGDDGVEVIFTKGKKTEKYDVLIAADGIGSRIRSQMLDAPARDQILDKGCHAAYFTIKSDLLEGGKLAKWYNSSGGRIIFLRPDPRGYTRAHLVLVTPKDNMERRKQLDDTLDQGNEAYKRLLEDLFKDAGWLAPEVLRGMRESDDFYCSLFAQTRSPRLCDGRVVLLGDAGYATPGIGTSLAIVGGYVLAGEILRHDGDGKSAAKAYGELMQPYVDAQQTGGDAMVYLNPQTEWGITVRNAIMRAATGLMLDRLVINGAAWLGLTEKKLAMPEYEWPAV